MDFSEKLEYIIVAYRNGKIEYELFAACTNRMDKCITDSTLENASHLTQDEVNKLIEYFDLKNRTLLSFSGWKGTFDFSFIINYCKRHSLVGFENLKYDLTIMIKKKSIMTTILTFCLMTLTSFTITSCGETSESISEAKKIQSEIGMTYRLPIKI